MRLRSVCLPSALAWITAACATKREPSAPPPLLDDVTQGSQARSSAPARFEQAVPACTSTLEFVRIDANPPFWISTTEVPWEMFDAFVYKKDLLEGLSNDRIDALTRPSQPYNPMDRGFGHNGYPAISMSAKNAQAFCEWLSTHTGALFRLPTEAEWELAARAGQTTDEAAPPAQLTDIAWLAPNSQERTHSIRSKAPNAFGLYDTIGNAGEWCTAPDGSPVMRGGTFKSPPEEARFSTRELPTPAWNLHDPQIPKSKWWLIDGGFVGFRIVCTQPAPPTN